MAVLPGRTGADRLAGEQAALRRVATLVARAAAPEEVFAAVAEEAGRLLGAHHATMSRYDPDATATVVASWSATGAAFPVGTSVPLGGRNAHTLVFQTRRPARIDDYAGASGPTGKAAREFGFRASVSVPVSVEGRLWGVMVVEYTREEPLPAGTEARLAGFTELAATAIANAQARVELRGFAEEQAALRRVATLVARAVPPAQVLTAVTEEAGQLLGADYTAMARYDPDGARTLLAAWSRTGARYRIGSSARLGGRNVSTLVFQTGRPARIDDYDDATGPAAEGARKFGLRAAVAVPVSVGDALWGDMAVISKAEPLPAGTEVRLAGFTELAATAIANAQVRVELRGFADEQAALGRVATMVASAAPPEQVFAAVTEEAGGLLSADYAAMVRYDADGARTVLAAWSRSGAAFPVGSSARLGGRNVTTLVSQTGRTARIDDYDDASGPIANFACEFDLSAAVGVPVSVEGEMWGAIVAGSRARPLPAGTEAQLAGFTKLAATAIANAQARVELRGSADEQAALRRVATLVAEGAEPGGVFAAVTEEAGQLLHTDYAAMNRYGADGTVTKVAAWSSAGATCPAGTRWSLGGPNVNTLVFRTGRAARTDDYASASGAPAEDALRIGLRAAVGVPVSVEGRLWGVMIVGSSAGPVPASTEARLAGFTELAATAIANAQARMELRGFAEEQAALRRVATLVAGGAPPEEVFAAVTGEARRLLGADYATMNRYGPDGTITIVAAWSGASAAIPVGATATLGGRNLHTMIFQTGRAARIDDYASASGPVAEAAPELGVRAAVGVPVSVEGRLGVIAVLSRAGPLPAGTEVRLAGFTELAATAIANADAQDALTASRARIVTTADATRRRIERNLHDGAQQHLVSLALDLRAAEATAPPGAEEHVHQLDEVAAGLDDVLEELREIARGLHPAILAEGGLRPALKTLARRSAVPVHLDIEVDRRLPEPVETAAYYTVAEALTNTAKHARATTADIQVNSSNGILHLRVHDNGRGGADFSHGSGLVGLKDRAEALGGRLQVHSLPGEGTTLKIDLPIRDPGGPPLAPDAAGTRQRSGYAGAVQRAAPGPPALDRDVRPPG